MRALLLLLLAGPAASGERTDFAPGWSVVFWAGHGRDDWELRDANGRLDGRCVLRPPPFTIPDFTYAACLAGLDARTLAELMAGRLGVMVGACEPVRRLGARGIECPLEPRPGMNAFRGRVQALDLKGGGSVLVLATWPSKSAIDPRALGRGTEGGGFRRFALSLRHAGYPTTRLERTETQYRGHYD